MVLQVVQKHRRLTLAKQ